MRSSRRIALLATLFGLLGGTAQADISCPVSADPNCLCLSQVTGTDQKSNSAGRCLTGKVDALDSLIDVTMALSYAAPEEAGDKVFNLLPLALEDLQSDGTFKITIPTPTPGTYRVRLATRYTANQSVVNFQDPPALNVNLVKETPPNFVAASVLLSGGGFSEPASKNFASAGSEFDKDGDGICDGPNDVSNRQGKVICTKGPDPVFNYQIALDPSTQAVRADTLKFCIKPAAAGALPKDGVTVSYSDKLTDGSRVIPLQGSSGPAQLGTKDFCDGGVTFSLQVANGINDISATVSTDQGKQDFAFHVPVDLKGPDLCVRYFDGQGKAIGRTDQETPIIAAPLAGSLTVQVEARACGTTAAPETLLVASAPCSSALCASVNDQEKKWQQVSGSKGTYSFLIDAKDLRFPLNFIHLTGKDSLGNETTKVVSFGYGKVYHPFDEAGKLDVSKGLVPDAVAGFISEPFLKDNLKPAIEKIVNSREFKLKFLPKVFEVKQPSDEEAESCGEKSRIHKDKAQYAMLDIPDLQDKAAIQEIDDMKVEIPSLYLLNQDTLWVQIKLKNFKRKAEIFAVTFNDTEAKKTTNVDNLPGSIDTSGPFTFGVPVVPVKFTVQELALNMQIKFSKDEEGRLQFVITDVPNNPPRNVVEAIGMDARLMVLECGKSGDHTRVHNTDGKTLSLDTNGCNGLGLVNSKANAVGVAPTKFNQNLDNQFMETLGTMVSCNIPIRLKDQLAKFDKDEAAMQATLKLFGKRMFLDLFAPIGKADLNVSTEGISFGGSGLMLPAGFQDAAQPIPAEGTFNAASYAASLPESLRKDPTFGPLYDADESEVDAPHEAQEIGSGMNLVIKENVINSALFGAVSLLDDVIGSQGQDHQLLDIDQKRLMDEFGFGINLPSGEKCLRTKDKTTLASPVGNDNNFDNWLCFPQPLMLDSALGASVGDLLGQQMDLDGDGNAATDTNVPMMIRTHLNPYAPPVVRLLNAAPLQAWNGKGPVKSSKSLLTLEINLGSSLMEIFEEEQGDAQDPLHTGSGKIKSWCDSDRAPFMNPGKCQGRGGSQGPLPVVSFRATGKLTIEALASVKDNILTLEGGLVSKISGMEGGKPQIGLDTAKTYLHFDVVENNTLGADSSLASDMKKVIGVVFNQYLFGKDGTETDIRLRIPLELPLGQFCKEHPEVKEVCDCLSNPDGLGCGLVDTVDNLLKDLDIEKYGIESANIDELLLNITDPIFGAPRYLGVGLKADVQ